MRIGLLTQWYDPEEGPASLPGVYAAEFFRQGHEVSVLTGFPNYPTGHVYQGYRIRPRLVEDRGGVRVTRTAIYPSHDSSAVRRAANYASFALTSTVLGAGALGGVDAIWASNSPPTVALPLLTHSRNGRIPYFLHVQDLWPESMTESGMLPQGALLRQAETWIRRLVGLLERRSAVIGVISRSVRDMILQRNPSLDPDRVVYAPNPANERLFRPCALIRQELGMDPHPSGSLRVMYAGAIGEAQGLVDLVDAAELVASRDDISIVVYGDGPSRARLVERARAKGLTNIEFPGRVEQEAIPGLMARASVQLVSLANRPFLEHTTPSKIAALLASGTPIVGHLAGDGARLIAESGAGVVTSPGDAEGLARALVALAGVDGGVLSELGESGRRYYAEQLSAKAAVVRMVQALGAVIDVRAG